NHFALVELPVATRGVQAVKPQAIAQAAGFVIGLAQPAVRPMQRLSLQLDQPEPLALRCVGGGNAKQAAEVASRIDLVDQVLLGLVQLPKSVLVRAPQAGQPADVLPRMCEEGVRAGLPVAEKALTVMPGQRPGALTLPVVVENKQLGSFCSDPGELIQR